MEKPQSYRRVARKLAKMTGLHPVEARYIIHLVFNLVSKELIDGKSWSLPNLGVLKTVKTQYKKIEYNGEIYEFFPRRRVILREKKELKEKRIQEARRENQSKQE